MESIEKISNQQLIAKKYIEENDLERIISEMLNSLVRERVKQPLVYMIKYLAGLMSEEERNQNGLVIPEPYPRGKPLAKFPYLKQDSLLKKYLTKDVFTNIKYLKTRQGGNINSIIKQSNIFPDDSIGCELTDGESLETFKDLLNPIIFEYHKIDYYHKFKDISSSTQINQVSFPFSQTTYPNIKKFVLEISRNIKDIPYENICGNSRRGTIEDDICKEIDLLITTKNLPEFKRIIYSEEAKEKWENILGLINFDKEYSKKAQLMSNYPENRSIYCNADCSIVILVNFNEHLQFFSVFNREDGKEINLVDMYNTLKRTISIVGRNLIFDYNNRFGYLNRDIRFLGSGLKLHCDFTISKLTDQDSDNSIEEILKGLCFDDYSSTNENGNEQNTMSIKVESICKLCEIDEIHFLEKFYNNIAGLIHLKKEDKKLNFAQKDFGSSFKPKDQNLQKAYEKVFAEEKNKITSSGYNINNVISYYVENPDNIYGTFLEDPSMIKTFNLFLNEYLLLSQNYEKGKILKSPQVSQLTSSQKEQIEMIDICLIRNIENYPFANSYLNENQKVENIISSTLNTLNLREHLGNYFSLDNENQKDQAQKIIAENDLEIYDKDNAISNKGVMQFNYENVFAVVNDFDHIKFYLHAKKPGEKFNDHLFNVLKVLNEFSKQIKFANDEDFGYVTSTPKFLGTGLVIKIYLKVKMYKEKIDKICREANAALSVGNEKKKEFNYEIVEDTVDGRTVLIKNIITIGKSENEILGDLVFFISYFLTRDDLINSASQE